MRLVVLAVAALLLSGCFGKGESQKDLEEQAAQAIGQFRSDVLAGGRLQGVHVGGWIEVESGGQFNFKVRLTPDVDVAIGPGGEVRIDGTLAGMRFTGYCDATRIVTVTQGTEQYGIREGSFESRNPVGHCAGEGTEVLLLQAFEFRLIDPAILTGALYVEDLEPVGFEDKGKKKLEAEYVSQGPEGTTTLFITVHGDKVVQIIANNAESSLVMDMVYAPRSALQAPAADTRLPSPVSGGESRTQDGWRWVGHTREGGPFADYSVVAYAEGTTVRCTGANDEAVVRFDLGNGFVQSDAAGWQLVFAEDGDGTLGAGDEIQLRQPSGVVQSFRYVVAIEDDWAGAPARGECAIPGAPLAGAVGLLAACLLRRRP